MTRFVPLGCAVAVSSLLWACGPKYARGVPKDVIERLPYESRIELLEAENDLAVADDKAEEARNEVTRTRDNIRRAKDRRGAASDELGRAKDALSREVARLAIDEADTRVDFLRARQEVNVRNEDAEEIALRCAYARFERSRLVAARKAKVAGSEKLDPKDYDNQVKDCDKELSERRKDVKTEEKRAEKFRLDWEVKKVALAKKTFDARASPYVE